jgi:hypothetical protein
VRERAALLITGKPDQHMGVEVGLESVELNQGEQQVATPSRAQDAASQPAKAA